MVNKKRESDNRKESGRNNKKPSTQVVKTTNALTLPGNASRTRLALPENLTEAQWQAVGDKLSYAGGSLMWWLGDWWAYGEDHKYGSRKEFVESWENGYSYGTCLNAGYVARHVQTSLRNEVLPYSYHVAVAKLTEPQQKSALTYAEKNVDKLSLSLFKTYIENNILKENGDDDNGDNGGDDDEADVGKLLALAADELGNAKSVNKRLADDLKRISEPDRGKVFEAVQKIADQWNETTTLCQPASKKVPA
jgi:hypothetical protein